jgi:hypothetical protein
VKVKLITFADGAQHWRDSASRLARQARESGLFAEVEVFDLQRLRMDFPEFSSRNEAMLSTGIRGFGYWIWKPFIILQSLLDSDCEFDVLVYLDAGCSLNHSSTKARFRFREYCSLAREFGGVAFQLPDHLERHWSKMDTILAVRGRPDAAMDSNQLVGGILVLNRSRATVDLIQKWCDYSTAENFHLVDDTPSNADNHPDFVSHRHDQSIWSLLVKGSNFRILGDETYFPRSWHTKGRNYPFWATRNATGLTINSDMFWAKVARKILRLLRP